MNRKQRRAKKLSAKDQAMMEESAEAFKKAKAAGEDVHFMLFHPNGITILWTGEESQKTAEEVIQVLMGAPTDLSGKQMVSWQAHTPEEKELVQTLRGRFKMA